jgi:hypothetical protein
MDKRGINIDVVFRNGLKDFEVLPPPEVWDKINPVLRRKQRPLILARTAAMIAIVISVSFLAYQWAMEMSNGLESVGIAFNELPDNPQITPALSEPVAINRVENTLIKSDYSNEAVVIIAGNEEGTGTSENSSPSTAPIQETVGLSNNNTTLSQGPQIASLSSYENDNSVDIERLTDSFLPVSEDVKDTERWSIAALASPTYYSRFSTGQDEVVQQLMNSEQPVMSYSGGVTFSYKINNRISIQSGLFFSSVGQEVGGINSFGGFSQYSNTKGSRNFEVMTTSGTIYTNNGDVFLSANGPGERISTSYTKDVFDPAKASLQYINDNLLQNFSYLELPIMLRYKFVDKTVDLNLVGGLSYNMLVNNSVYTMVDGSKYFVGKTEGLNMMMLSSSLGMAMEYSFSEKLSLNLEPTFRYYLNPFSPLSSSVTHPYSFGIFSGVSYKF